MVLLVFGVSALYFTACDNSVIGKYYHKISDYRNVLMTAETDDFILEMISGVRENPFLSDGVCSADKKEYTVFTLTPKSSLVSGDTATLICTLDGAEHTLTLARHPFLSSYSVEVEVSPAEEEKTELNVSVNDVSVTLAPCLSSVDGEYALTSALERLGDKIKLWNDYEIHLRLSENTITLEGGWYWYVAFIHDGETTSVLLSAETGEITAVRG